MLKKAKSIRNELLKVRADQKVIRFYETNRPYGQFTNFALYPIEINDKVWPTSEHYFSGTEVCGE